jgi:hypothetical protein
VISLLCLFSKQPLFLYFYFFGGKYFLLSIGGALNEELFENPLKNVLSNEYLQRFDITEFQAFLLPYATCICATLKKIIIMGIIKLVFSIYTGRKNL